MKIKLENLGILRQAEFRLGDLTLICGGNNTGKTYAAYALFGFLSNWRHLLKFDVPSSQIDSLQAEGSIQMDIQSCIDRAGSVLRRGCQNCAQDLPTIFASKPAYFRDSRFQVELEPEEFSDVLERAYSREAGFQKPGWMTLEKEAGSSTLTVSLLSEAKTNRSPPNFRHQEHDIQRLG